MKVKTSVTLEKTLLKEIATHRGEASRSEFIESAVRQQIRQMQKKDRDARDIAIINKNAKRLNAEAEDVLGYQIGI
jgi:metal-responsive CopG/Arc/MetJ family transcriptional regulator